MVIFATRIDVPLYVMNSETFVLQENVDQVLRAVEASKEVGGTMWELLQSRLEITESEV